MDQSRPRLPDRPALPAAGGLVFGVLYGAGWLAWRHDQNLIGVVRAAVRYRSRYDAGLLEDRSP